MKERPILFSGPMVRAILEGRKTQTRRIVKPQPPANVTRATMVPTTASGKSTMVWCQDGPIDPLNGWNYKERHPNGWRCPYGMHGDRLWVREAFQPLFADGVENHWETDWKTGKGYSISYPATDGIHEYLDADDNLKDACKPSIHMPRWASRITLEITGIRVERLQDISEEDAAAEGSDRLITSNCTEQDRALLDLPLCDDANPYRNGFALLWESINGDGSWAANPWVWAIEFRRLL